MARLLVIQHIDREGPGIIQKISEEKGLETKIFKPYKNGNLPEPKSGDLLVLMGGPMGVNDMKNKKYSWLSEEINLINKTIDRNLPVIGICLGAQLLAKSIGGKIEKLRTTTAGLISAEIGWGEIYFKLPMKNASSDKPRLNTMNVLHWHGDRIILPKNATLIASSSRCKEQIFKFNNICFGLQCHLEATNEMVYRWIEEDKEFIVSSLGNKGQELLYQQQKKYGLQSEKERTMILNKIIDQSLSY